MTQNISSFPALNRLMATYVFALLIPIHYFAMLVLASSKVTVLAYWMKQ